MRSTHATEIKFETHVLWTHSFEIVKKKCIFKFASIENEFFCHPVHFVKGEKNSFSILATSNAKIFFNKIEVESSLHMCVKFDFSRVCRTHKNFQLLIKLLLKIIFPGKFFLFSMVHSNYRYFSIIYKIFTELSSTEFYLWIF